MGWSRYSQFFPERLRDEPAFEQWACERVDIRVARQPVARTPLTCVVLHGAGGNAELMAPILAGLRQAGFDALAPDLPGYGRSVVPGGRFTYETWVACVRALVQAEHERTGRPVVVVGASMGGMLGYHVAALAPEVAAVIATNLLDARDPAVRRGVSRPSFVGRAAGLLRPPLDPIRVPIRWLCKMSAIANDPAFARACMRDPRGGGSRVPLGFLRTWLRYAPAIEPEQFTRPVLLAHPGDDRWTPVALSRRFFDRLAGPKNLVLLENCGHAPVEEPGLSTLERELRAFLAGLGQGRTRPAS